MVKCPRCSKPTNSGAMQLSRLRQGVLICNDCSYDGLDTREWHVDNVPKSKELKDYFKAREDFIIAYNCSDDKQQVST